LRTIQYKLKGAVKKEISSYTKDVIGVYLKIIKKKYKKIINY